MSRNGTAPRPPCRRDALHCSVGDSLGSRRRAPPATYSGARYELRSGLRQRLHRRLGVVAGGSRIGWPAGERGSLLQNKYDHVFTVEPASKAEKAVDWVPTRPREERDIAIASAPLEATTFQVENIRWTYVFYESGLSINVLYPLDDPKKRAVGSSSPKGWRSPPSWAHSSLLDRSRSWPGRSGARTS